jgi:hypothetical protein
MNIRSARRSLSAPMPCPSWCDRSWKPPDDLTDGFMHHSAPVILAVTGGGNWYPQSSLEMCIESWVPSRAARPAGGVITWYEDGTPGPSMTVREARDLAGILFTLIAQVQDGPLRHRPDARCAHYHHERRLVHRRCW